MQILILSGPKQSGKTTFLEHVCQENRNIKGVLSPVIRGRRWFQWVNEEMPAIPFEANEGFFRETYRVGKYTFIKDAFDTVITRLLDTNANDWLLIDEIGPLELEGKGFFALVENALKKGQKMIWVVREELLENVILFFELNDRKELSYHIIKDDIKGYL